MELYSCPVCSRSQDANNATCETCGIVFSKHMAYTPIKTMFNRIISPKEIMGIRRAEERFTKIKHDNQSKAELIIHCQKENLLDLASYHTRRENDKTGMELIKKLSSLFYIGTQKTPRSLTPTLVVFGSALILLLLLTLILRAYV